MALLTPQEIALALEKLTGWRLESAQLIRDFEFLTFVSAMDFVNQVAAAAEHQNHHPDIDIRYNKVRLALSSHDAGGITERDLHLASSISVL